MRIETTPRRPAAENIVPMINVVFLLLIFFLMTAQIAPPEPIEVTPPTAELEEPGDAELMLYVGPDGAIAFQDARGGAAVSRLAEGAALSIRADAAVEATAVAALLARLAEAGFAEVTLVTAVP